MVLARQLNDELLIAFDLFTQQTKCIKKINNSKGRNLHTDQTVFFNKLK